MQLYKPLRGNKMKAALVMDVAVVVAGILAVVSFFVFLAGAAFGPVIALTALAVSVSSAVVFKVLTSIVLRKA